MHSTLSTTPFAVWVEFQVPSELMPAFMPLMLANAEASLSGEPGCNQFDVMVPQQSDGTVCLFETYDSQAAFSEHLESAHFKRFSAATGQMIKSRKILTFDLVAGSPGCKKAGK